MYYIVVIINLVLYKMMVYIWFSILFDRGICELLLNLKILIIFIRYWLFYFYLMKY